MQQLTKNTDKSYCREIADLLAAHGVKHCVLCPGSRNAPLIVALHRHPALKCFSVIDERSAAFTALGLASISGKPVAIVCTSGSAVLNFAPAVAEAYYRQVPLIVISADRPEEWIDQDDSQTIRQPGILSHIVKGSCNVQVELTDSSPRARAQAWHINRLVNDCLSLATGAPDGPVHINVQLDAPLGAISPAVPEADFARKITIERPSPQMPTAQVRELAQRLQSPAKVLIIAGFMAPDEKVSRALATLSTLPNVAILTEAQANVHGSYRYISNIDSVLCRLSSKEKQEMLPDVVITIGGSLVSRFVKAWLRSACPEGPGYHASSIKHWHIGMQPQSVDCFMLLDLRIALEARYFLPALAAAMRRQPQKECGYAKAWANANARAQEALHRYSEGLPWSDFTAMRMLMQAVPSKWNLQLSNGTAVRYAQLFGHSHLHRIDCNRGVSGIDGCVSTAVGASMAYSGTTLLVTGDMSMQYDIGALASAQITQKLKIAVLNNGGGAIFRFVDSTRSLPEREDFFCCTTVLPLRDLAQAYGFAYYEATSKDEFEKTWPKFQNESERPAILNIVTPAEVSAEILHGFFKN